MSTKSIREAWERSVKRLEPAMIDGWTEDEVLNELYLGRAQLWAGDEAAVVTRCYPPDVFHVWLAGGAISGVLGLIPGGIAWARPMGLKRMTINGRRGWARVLGKYGFTGSGMLERAI